MPERKHVHGLSLRFMGDTAVINVGRKEIWDGADLSLFRDAFRELVDNGSSSVGVDLAGVQYLPGGFFGELMDWCDRGISIEVVAPHERVRQMLWFQEFFEQVAVGRHALRPDKSTFRLKIDDAQQVEPPMSVRPLTAAAVVTPLRVPADRRCGF